MEHAFEASISAVTPDWSRERPRRLRDPGRQLLSAVRRLQALQGRRGPVAALQRAFWSGMRQVWGLLTQSEISPRTEIGGGLLLPHPTGIIIHPGARIGVNCLIFQQVTLAGKVTVGGHVDIGAGAKLLGPITIGDHVRIGANAVVTCDIPSHCDAIGVPARIVRRTPEPARRPRLAPVPSRGLERA